MMSTRFLPFFPKYLSPPTSISKTTGITPLSTPPKRFYDEGGGFDSTWFNDRCYQQSSPQSRFSYPTVSTQSTPPPTQPPLPPPPPNNPFSNPPAVAPTDFYSGLLTSGWPSKDPSQQRQQQQQMRQTVSSSYDGEYVNNANNNSSQFFIAAQKHPNFPQDNDMAISGSTTGNDVEIPNMVGGGEGGRTGGSEIKKRVSN